MPAMLGAVVSGPIQSPTPSTIAPPPAWGPVCRSLRPCHPRMWCVSMPHWSLEWGRDCSSCSSRTHTPTPYS